MKNSLEQTQSVDEEEDIVNKENLTQFTESETKQEVKSKINNELSLSEQLKQDKQLWEEVKDKWIESGRTEADFNSMNNEEKEHIIKNCL